MIRLFYTFSLWIWIFSLLYILNLSNFSLIYASLFALIFTSFNLFNKKHKLDLFSKIRILLIELIVFIMNLIKHIFIQKRNLIEIKDLIFNFLLFFFYLLFINYILKKDVRLIYFHILRQK